MEFVFKAAGTSKSILSSLRDRVLLAVGGTLPGSYFVFSHSSHMPTTPQFLSVNLNYPEVKRFCDLGSISTILSSLQQNWKATTTTQVSAFPICNTGHYHTDIKAAISEKALAKGGLPIIQPAGVVI